MSRQKYNRLADQWHTVLTDVVQAAERLCRSSQRERKLSVEQLVQTLVLGCLEKGEPSLQDWADIAYELGVSITASGINQRLSTRLVMTLFVVLEQSIAQRLDVSRLPVEALKRLGRFLIYDSTRMALSPNLKHEFTDATRGHASVKMPLGYDYTSAQFVDLALHRGIDPDQTNHAWVEQAQAGDCVAVDKGFFKLDHLVEVTEKAAYFIIPLQVQAALYEVNNDQRIALAEKLRHHDADTFELTCHLGAAQRLPCRLTARRLSREQAAEKRRKVRQRAKDEGYTPSQTSLTLCEWHILVTNLGEEWTLQQIFDLYGVRWQIELIFKGWKSYLQLEQSGYWREERVMCQLLASLIGATLCQSSFALFRWSDGQEISFFRTLTLIQRALPHLYRVIQRDWYGTQAWAQRLGQAIRKLAPQQNLETKPSTLRYLLNWG